MQKKLLCSVYKAVVYTEEGNVVEEAEGEECCA